MIDYKKILFKNKYYNTTHRNKKFLCGLIDIRLAEVPNS